MDFFSSEDRVENLGRTRQLEFVEHNNRRELLRERPRDLHKFPHDFFQSNGQSMHVRKMTQS